jgi:hypothetical protein
MAMNELTKGDLIAQAERLEALFDDLKYKDSADAALEAQDYYQEAARYRQWAEHGCLIGEPESSWKP